MQKRWTMSLAILFLAAAVIPLHAGAIFVNGEVTASGTPFSETINGITANFSCTGDPSNCIPLSTTGTVSWGPEMLLSVTAPATLTIQFSQTLDWITLDFGTFQPDTFQLTLLSGGPSGSQVGQTTQSGTQIVSNGFYEGSIGSSGVSFDTVELTDPNGGSAVFGVGNISVADAPEPGSLWMISGLGLSLVWWKRRR
jgi:hypothetical protein